MIDINKIKIKIVDTADASRLVEIYRYYVENTAITFEYNTPTVDEFKERITNTLQRYPYIKAVYNDKILGYAYVSSISFRKAYDWSVEPTIYIDKDYKHLGIGTKLYNALEDILKGMNIQNLIAVISYPKEDNDFLTKNSKYFHDKLGYTSIGLLHDCAYKFNQWYDVIIMEKSIKDKNEVKDVKNFNDIKKDIIKEYNL